eukprot:1217546-Pyramimonas_sp.AAC.1
MFCRGASSDSKHNIRRSARTISHRRGGPLAGARSAPRGRPADPRRRRPEAPRRSEERGPRAK